ncbi:MAG: sensor histidine kinase [Micromonospora sp.]
MTGDDRSPFPPEGLRHDALLYDHDREYLDGVRDFVAAGRAAGEPVLVAVPTDRLPLVRPILDAFDGVEFADMAVIGRNPAAIIPATLRDFIDRFSGRRLRIVGESLWPGRRAAAYRHCVEHEAMINFALADRPLTVRCLFDRSRLPGTALADIGRTHPWLISRGAARASGGYQRPRAVLDRLARPLPAPPRDAVTLLVDTGGLAALRAAVATVATSAGVAEERVDDLRIAVTELASNALTHGTGPATARCWVKAGELLCEVSGRGELTDPLAGRIPPPRDGVRGRGLLLVHQLSDLVDVHTADGVTTVRLHLDLDRDPAPPAVPAPRSAPGATQGGFALAPQL